MRWAAAAARTLALTLALALPAGAEEIVAGLSQTRVSITADFDGSEILVYGAVKRDAPLPEGPPLQVIITVEGPSTPVTVRRKERVAGVWINRDAVLVDAAPSFHAVATTAPLATSLNEVENLRHRITTPRAIRAIGLSSEVEDPDSFLQALMRIKEREGRFRMMEGRIQFTEQTLFRADVALPADLTEGEYRVRMFLTREGRVVDAQDRVIFVRKEGLERFLHRLAIERPFIYGLVSLLLAVGAGWAASAAFRLVRA